MGLPRGTGNTLELLRDNLGRQLGRNALPAKFSRNFAKVCTVTRVSDSGSHVPSNAYSLYTCSTLVGGLYTCIIYTAWYLNTSTAAVLFRYSSTTAVLSRYSSSTTVLSLVQLYGEYTRRVSLVCDPVESGAVSRLLNDVIF